MKAEETAKTWRKTKRQNLLLHKSGRYYARLFLNGKEIWKSLKTSHFSVAEAKLADALKEHRERRAMQVDPSNAKMTFEQAAQLHMQHVADDLNLKRSTRKYCLEIHTALLKSWPSLGTTEIRRITAAACREWAVCYARQMSATRFNGAVSFLRHVMRLAVDNGVVFVNVADSLERARVKSKRPEMPTLAKFAEFVAEMRLGHSRDSLNCADLTEGLAYTGCRIGEAKEIIWNNLNFATNEIRVQGDPEEGTKNSEERTIPMISAAKVLFQRMRHERSNEPGTERIYLVHECQGAINRASKSVGMKRITHHDLRHFFATICIESGVDIPTVSRWMGHKDGGALAMKTYGHLRREHSAAQALKVSFAPSNVAA